MTGRPYKAELYAGGIISGERPLKRRGILNVSRASSLRSGCISLLTAGKIYEGELLGLNGDIIEIKLTMAPPWDSNGKIQPWSDGSSGFRAGHDVPGNGTMSL